MGICCCQNKRQIVQSWLIFRLYESCARTVPICSLVIDRLRLSCHRQSRARGRTQDQVPYETTQHEAPFGRGILKKEDFYMKRLVADSLRTLEVLQQIPEIDPQRIILRGGSQGGGIALLVNALTNVPIFATFADVPSHSILSIGSNKKQEVTRWFKSISNNFQKRGNDLSSHELFWFEVFCSSDNWSCLHRSAKLIPSVPWKISSFPIKRFLDRKNCVFT